jgi:CMP-N-acetylneuraminic acid synthetase|tara:strand:+ start:360 stop:593 length:234 start_codon:yes stop_codon:yes gene_type:complete
VHRKNLRVVGGKPLVAYAIETAFDARSVELVVVSTEDEEIASVSESFGAEIIDRPALLSEDEVSLPEVIKHSYKSLP